MKVAERRDAIANVAVAYTSPAFTLEQMLSWSMVFKPSGAVSGTLKIQTSNDAYQPPTGNAMYLIEASDALWIDDPSTVVILAASTGHEYNFDANDGIRYRRVVWTPSGGTGTAVLEWWAKGRI